LPYQVRHRIRISTEASRARPSEAGTSNTSSSPHHRKTIGTMIRAAAFLLDSTAKSSTRRCKPSSRDGSVRFLKSSLRIATYCAMEPERAVLQSSAPMPSAAALGGRRCDAHSPVACAAPLVTKGVRLPLHRCSNYMNNHSGSMRRSGGPRSSSERGRGCGDDDLERVRVSGT